MLAAAESYCAATGTEITTLGRIIVNDGKFFPRIKNGGGCNLNTHQNVMNWFKEHKPRKSKLKRSN
jgi:hypothetical protein